MPTHPVRFNSFHRVSFPILAHFIIIFSWFILFLISDLMSEEKGAALPSSRQHANHVLSLFRKYLFWAFKTGWISLIFTGYNSDYVIFIVDYKFIMETLFSLDTEYFWHLATCRVIMFIMDYMLDYVISWTCEVYHDILISLQSISCKTVSRNFFFFDDQFVMVDPCL